MKKLVPAIRSRINSRHAGSNTAKASNAMQEVINHAQDEIGIRINVIPLVRKSSVVAMKFNAPSRDATQNNAMEIPHKVCPMPRPGPASEPTALNGGGAVPPGDGGPPGKKNTATRTTNAPKLTPNTH